MGKYTISMAIDESYVKLPEGRLSIEHWELTNKDVILTHNTECTHESWDNMDWKSEINMGMSASYIRCWLVNNNETLIHKC